MARMPLSGERLFSDMMNFFSKVPDHRDISRIDIALKDFLMSGLAVFSLKFPSLLSFEEEMKGRRAFSQLSKIYGLQRVPSDTQMRAVLDEVPSQSLRPAFNLLFQKAQRQKVLKEFEIWDSHYLLSVDGTGFFYSDSVHCDSCIEKKHKATGEKSFYHQMFAGAIVHPEKNTVIPLCPEPIQKQDGENKNDCERNAMKRFIEQFRRDHPKLKVILLTDALHATAPNLRLLELNNMSFILAIKPGSHEKLFTRMEEWKQLNQTRLFTVEEEIGDKIKKKRIHEYHYSNGCLLNASDASHRVNFLDYVETTQWVDTKGQLKTEKKHFSWVTDYSLYDSSCVQIAKAARTRWKIENEVFNTLKNHGYEFEHNFGHGYKNLSTNFAYLMMIAFMIDQLQEMGCDLFKKLLEKRGRRSSLWSHLKSTYLLLPFPIEGFTQFLNIVLEPEKWIMIKDTC